MFPRATEVRLGSISNQQLLASYTIRRPPFKSQSQSAASITSPPTPSRDQTVDLLAPPSLRLRPSNPWSPSQTTTDTYPPHAARTHQPSLPQSTDPIRSHTPPVRRAYTNRLYNSRLQPLGTQNPTRGHRSLVRNNLRYQACQSIYPPRVRETKFQAWGNRG